ncbi:MAG: hypothetical protein H7101_12850 [Deinococcales bacterium]|nr:hypothetical protein [Chitinophagaceae bacterium]
MYRLKKLIIFLSLLLLSSSGFNQSLFNYDSSNFKKVVRIGIYISPKVNLHTRVITDIAHYYEEEKVIFDKGLSMPMKDSSEASLNNKKLDEYHKMRRDSADAFDRIFTSAAGFLNVSFNRSQSSYNSINYDDTLFIPFVKVESIKPLNANNIIKRDTLDYFINVQNFNSVQKGSYYNIAFLVTINPKDKTKKVISKTLIIPYINLQTKGFSFFSCDNCFECLVANTTYLFATTVAKKLYEDGFRKNDYASYKKEKALVK